MHLIFIRHGDPDYKNNTVTEKGARESAYLAERIAGWDVTDFYVSPYGRAQDTLKPALLKMERTAVTLPWLREFDHHVIDPVSGKERSCCWDWMPRYYYKENKFFDRKRWFAAKPLRQKDIESRYREVCDGFDALLAQYDYTRDSRYTAIYNCLPHLTDEEAAVDTHLLAQQKNLDGKNLVFVCHLGVMFAIIAHLTGMSPVQLWQGCYVAPTSVTVLGAEERVPGEVVFRVQQFGDVRHLYAHGEPASACGFFGNIFDL
ncbi:MAG TPA: histidine phosphatase family protein [Treponema sp.]|nr:histidine phosphatase family protein [Treponema sp.]